MRFDIHIHHHNDKQLDRIFDELNSIKQTLKTMATDLTQLEAEVSENLTVTQSAITLLQGLKAMLDAAGTDPVKLKELSDSLSNSTDALAAAVSANTPATPTE